VRQRSVERESPAEVPSAAKDLRLKEPLADPERLELQREPDIDSVEVTDSSIGEKGDKGEKDKLVAQISTKIHQATGHSTLEMTRRYANLVTEDLQKIHERLTLLSAMR